MTWPSIPPEYEGRTWNHADSKGVHESRFPPMKTDPFSPPTEEFTAFQLHHVQQMAAEAEWLMIVQPDLYCPNHRRALTPRELRVGVCFWCRPDRYPRRPSKAAVAVEPSEVDDDDAQEELF